MELPKTSLAGRPQHKPITRPYWNAFFIFYAPV